MSLNGALSVANSGLANVQAQFAVVSQNVANASTPGYATETATQQAITAGGQGMGVLTGPTMRQVNAALEASLTAQNSTVSGLQTRSIREVQCVGIRGRWFWPAPVAVGEKLNG